MKMQRVAQVAMEVVVILGILVIGSVVMGVLYINSHNKGIENITNLNEVKDAAQADLYPVHISTASQTRCGNGIKEPGEDCRNCSSDFPEGCPLNCSDGYFDSVHEEWTDCGKDCPYICSCGNLVDISFDPNPVGLFSRPLAVTLRYSDPSCIVERIYYTIDGSTPTTSSSFVQATGGQVTISPENRINSSKTIRAKIFATHKGNPVSKETSKFYYFRITDPCIYFIDHETSIPYSVGTGESEDDPKTICSATQLFKITEDIDGGKNLFYLLGADIDLLDEKLVEESTIEGWEYDPDNGWMPLGNLERPFFGVFDGGNYTILNAKINNTDNSGLFGVIKGTDDRFAEIKNLNLKNISFIESTNDNIGALVGYSEIATIDNCSATGKVVGNNYTGGLVGKALSTTISNSYTIVDTIGTENIGGLVGTLTEDSRILESYSLGPVLGNSKVGGLVGYSEKSTILNSYSMGLVTANEEMAGFIGSVTEGVIENSYSTGKVYKRSNNKLLKDLGFISTNDNTQIIQSYWDKDASGQSTSIGGGTGLNNEEMTIEESFRSYASDWDFEAIWQMSEINNKYPHLVNNQPE